MARDNRIREHFSALARPMKRRQRQRRAASFVKDAADAGRPVECNTSAPFVASRCVVSGSGTTRGIRESAFRASFLSQPHPRVAETAGAKDGTKRLISSSISSASGDLECATGEKTPRWRCICRATFLARVIYLLY